MFVASYAMARTRHNNIYVTLRRKHRFQNEAAATIHSSLFGAPNIGVTRRHKLVHPDGFEPTTFCVSSRCATTALRMR